jgi:hypothetical protein
MQQTLIPTTRYLYPLEHHQDLGLLCYLNATAHFPLRHWGPFGVSVESVRKCICKSASMSSCTATKKQHIP